MRRLFLLALFFSVQASAIHWRRGEAAHIVADPKSALERLSLERLTAYVEAVLGAKSSVQRSLDVAPAARPAIVLVGSGGKAPLSATPPQGSEEAFAIVTGRAGGRDLAVVAGASGRGLKRAVQLLILKSRQTGGGLEIPDLKIAEKPWIPEREFAICPWAPRHVRGAFFNPWADNRMDIWRYSGDQLARYVAMFDAFGFSGVQLLDTSYSYGVLGSPDAFQDRQRAIARLARHNGQNVSLWVWAAQFNGFGWSDPDVVYEPRPGMTAFGDPLVRRGFEKYYEHYAGLAPDVDRLIGHFYDPGRLRDRKDVFRYMRLLESKFRAKNPKIKLAIDTWSSGKDYLEQLIGNGFTDYTLLAMSMPNVVTPEQRNWLHGEAKRLGLQVGVWGWYTTEYETDQLASMYVNAEVLSHFYRQVRDGAARIHPITYWSEMEAHHLNNIWSMYAAAQLLWNPDRDPNAILAELADAIWGPINGPKVLRAVELIQDARSGPTWDTYWWRMPSYRLGTADPKTDLRRAEMAIGELRSMKTDPAYIPKLPLPFPPATFVELMLPHLEQIRAFAKFRADLESGRTDGWQPIPEYTTWTGVFGQPEARMQEILLRKRAKETGTPFVEPAWVRSRDAGRLLDKLRNLQRTKRDALLFKGRVLDGFQWPSDKLEDRIAKLLADGALERVGDAYRLVNWRNFAHAGPEGSEP